MELQGSGMHVKLSTGINTTVYINVRTPVCNFCNNLRLLHHRAIGIIAKYFASTSVYTYLPYVNLRLSTCSVFLGLINTINMMLQRFRLYRWLGSCRC